TVAAGWTVKDMAAHLLGDNIGNLARRRDGFREAPVSLATWDELVAWLNRRNQNWVETMRRMSPRLLCDLLQSTGEQVNAYWRTLDPYALGSAVAWAGPEPAPVWLDLAREFTEQWHHQQHIRDAVGKPGATGARLLAPVLAAFVHALPHTYREVQAPEGTAVTLTITGESGGAWSVVREEGRWKLYAGKPLAPQAEALAEVVFYEEVAWRLFTKGITRDAARQAAVLHGDAGLGEKMLEAVSIIA
ncbi:MAG: maleylpyruvate isomerase N-terminal domain-containing protein, partial [Anaerolineae bacterium]